MTDESEYLKEMAEPGVFTEWQEVSVEVYDFTDLGMQVVINNDYLGLVYDDHVYGEYKVGQQLKAYIKFIRDDGKIDVSLHPKKGLHVSSVADKIMAHLESAGGKSRFSDKSSPKDIEAEFKISKRVFKQAIGALYKQGKIKIKSDGIEIVK